MRGVIPALLRFKAAGYELVIVTNQDGLGTPSYPREPFERADAFVHGLLASQGIEFAADFICPHPAEAGCDCRKPAIGLVRDYVNDGAARPRRFRDGRRPRHRPRVRAQPRPQGLQVRQRRAPRDLARDRARAARPPARRRRSCAARRKPTSTSRVDLDSETEPRREHRHRLLRPHARAARQARRLRARAAVHGRPAHRRAPHRGGLRARARRSAAQGARRQARHPALRLPAADGRSATSQVADRPRRAARTSCSRAQFPRERVGELPTELVPHFFRSLAETLGAAIHVSVRGENAHHMVEACFKGVGRALRQAFARRGESCRRRRARCEARRRRDRLACGVEPRVAALRARAARRAMRP